MSKPTSSSEPPEPSEHSESDTFDPMDPALQRILGVLGDDGSIEECLVSAWLMSIPDAVSLSLGDLDALSLSASQRYLLKVSRVMFCGTTSTKEDPPTLLP